MIDSSRIANRSEKVALVDLVAIFALLAAMLKANTEWMFTREGYIDTWMYFGFFRHYNVASYLATNKKIARLPWILLGSAVNKVFSPQTAALVLHAGCFALGLLLFYILTVRLFGRRTAVLASLVYLTWVPMHGFGGWDYHNTFVPATYLAAYLALIWAASAQRNPFGRFFVFGVLFALAFHTNILTILLVPAMLIRGAQGVRSWSRDRYQLMRWLGVGVTGFAVGGIAITVVLGLVNVAFGRIFLFPGILVSRSAVLVAHPELNVSEWQPWSNPWWIGDIHTPLFDATLVLIVVCAIFAVRRCSIQQLFASAAACAMLEYVVSLVPFAAGQTEGQELLQPFYMAMPLAMPMLLAFAALIAVGIRTDQSTEARTDPQATRITTLLTVFAALAFGIQFVGRLTIDPHAFDWVPPALLALPPMLVIFGGFLLVVLINKLAAPRGRAVASFLVLAVALGQANALWPMKVADRAPYDYRSTCRSHHALLAAVAGADDLLFPQLLAGRQVVLWYQAKEASGPADCQLETSDLGGPLFAMGYGALAHFWDPDSSPSIPQGIQDHLTAGRDVVVLISNDDAYVSGIVARMHRSDPSWNESAVHTVGSNGITFKLHVISAANKSPST